MKKTALAIVLAVFCFCFCGCGSNSSEPTETAKTAKLTLHFDFGDSTEERVRASDISFIAKAQQKKVEWIHGWLTSATHPENNHDFHVDFGNDIPCQTLIVEPGDYQIWIGAYANFDEQGKYTFCLFSDEKAVNLKSGENSENIILELSEFQPITVTLPSPVFPEDIIEAKGKSAFWEMGTGEFCSCLFPFANLTVAVGSISLGVTELKIYFKDKIYSVAPEKMIDSLLFDESIILAEYPFTTVATTILDIGIPDNKVVAGTANLAVLKFQAPEDINTDTLYVAKKGTSDNDISEVTLISEDVVVGKSEIVHNHACFYFLNGSLVVPKGTIFTLLADVSTAAGDGNKFSFEILAADNPNLCPLKQVAPEFTVVPQGVLSVEKTGDSPSSAIVLAGSTGNVFTSVKISAKGEDIGINSLTLCVSGIIGEYRDVANVAIYEDATLLAQAAIPSTGYYIFSFSPEGLVILNGKSKVITVRVDMSTIDPVNDNAPGTDGADVKIVLSDIKATGMISCASPDINSLPVESSPMFLHASRPIVECSSSWNSMGAATTLSNGYCNLFNFRVTADYSGGEVLLNKIGLKFQFSSPDIKIGDITIRDQEGYHLNYGSPVCEGESCLCGFPLNNPDFDVAGEGEECIEIAPGQSKIFYVWAKITGAKTGSFISTTLLGDDASGAIGTAGKTAKQANFVWSDNYQQKSLVSATAHYQWYNGYLIPGLEELPYTIEY